MEDMGIHEVWKYIRFYTCTYMYEYQLMLLLYIHTYMYYTIYGIILQIHIPDVSGEKT